MWTLVLKWIHCWKSSFWFPDQSSGVQNVPLGRADKMDKEKSKKKIFQGVNFAIRKRPFLDFFENFQNRQFWSSNFSMKTAPTEKTECTMTKATENGKKLSSQIFNFQTFVTEIFRFKVSHFSFFQKFRKIQILTELAAELRMLPQHLN